MALPDPTDQITQALADPASVSADGVTVQARSIDDQIKGIQFGAMLAAMGSRRRGIRYSQLIPPGPITACGRGTGEYCGCGFNGGGW